jgi:hypothetical protein
MVPGQGERTPLHLPHGVTVWPCAAHRDASLQTSRAGGIWWYRWGGVLGRRGRDGPAAQGPVGASGSPLASSRQGSPSARVVLLARVEEAHRAEIPVDPFALLQDSIAAAAPRPWRLSLDGVDLSGDYLAVEAMTIREIGPNLPLAPHVVPRRGPA